MVIKGEKMKHVSRILNELLSLLSFTSKERITIFRTFRSCLYLFFLILLILGMWVLAKHYQTDTFSEYGPIENIQIIILIVTTLLFLLRAIKDYQFRPILLFLASLTAFCSIRELDAFFEKLIPVISWKFAWFFPLLGLWNMFRKRKTLQKPLFIFLDSNAFHIMLMALVVFVPLAQCIGHRAFIANAIGTSDNLICIRRLIEESMELMAYVLIFLSSIEMFLESNQKRK